MAKKNITAEMENMNAATETVETSKRTSMTPEEKAARKAERKSAKKAAAGVVREFLSSAEGKEWANAAGDFGKALLTLFPGRVTAAVKEASGPREVARCVTVCNYIADHGTVTDLEMFQQFKVGVAETRKLIRDFTKKMEKSGEALSFFIRRTEDGEGWEALHAVTPVEEAVEASDSIAE